MQNTSYIERRGQVADYFDRTAVEAWKRLTSDLPVGRIRATVRAGRNEMRDTLLGWLPSNMSGRTLLDAGCGTGALATEAARKGADVLAIDLSPTLVGLAKERSEEKSGQGRIRFLAGDMLDPAHGTFDHIVAMDSLIHYQSRDAVKAIAGLAARARHSVLITLAPRTPLLATMHAVGRFFPRSDRAPSIEPVSDTHLRALIAEERGLDDWQIARTRRIASGFYISQAWEFVRR